MQTGALDLLGERLPLVADNIRQEVTFVVKNIVDEIHKFIVPPHDDPVVQSAFRALRAIGLSLQSGEESTVIDVIPSVLSTIKEKTAAAPVALASLVPFSSVSLLVQRSLNSLTSLCRTKLGPRFIPYMRDTVVICVDIISTGRKFMLTHLA